MDIIVNRFVSDDDSTISQISINGRFQCFGLEDEFRWDKVVGETRIPSGIYDVGIREFCFVSGRYIPPRYQGTTAIRPFKNGEWCYKYEYDKYLTHSKISDRLTEQSELICIATQSKTVRPYTMRPLVENNEHAIRKHLSTLSEHYKLELTAGDTNFKLLRATYFLKPNGKPFPIPR